MDRVLSGLAPEIDAYIAPFGLVVLWIIVYPTGIRCHLSGRSPSLRARRLQYTPLFSNLFLENMHGLAGYSASWRRKSVFILPLLGPCWLGLWHIYEASGGTWLAHVQDLAPGALSTPIFKSLIYREKEWGYSAPRWWKSVLKIPILGRGTLDNTLSKRHLVVHE